MVKILIFVVSIALIAYCIKRLLAPKRPDFKPAMRLLGLLVIATGLLLALTGKLHILGVLLAGLIPIFRTVFPWVLKFLPNAIQHWQTNKGQNKHYSDHSSHQRIARGNQAMTVTEAYQVLQLQPGASKQQIIQRHKELMQKNHPDRGGSHYLASQINIAKKCLLEQFDPNIMQ